MIVAFGSFNYTSVCPFSFTYTSTLSNGSPLPSFITLNAASLSYSVFSSNPADAGTYSIETIGTLNDDAST